VGWHRNPGTGPTWITDEELAEAVEERVVEDRLSERVGAGGLSRPLVESEEEAWDFLHELAAGTREAAANGYWGR
jgi:hypothetical protein